MERPNHHARIRALLDHTLFREADASPGDLSRDALVGHDGRRTRRPRWLGPAVAPDRKRDEQQIRDDETDDIGFAAKAESITVQPLAEHEIDAIPGHQDREKTNHAGHHQTKLRPPAGEPSVQSEDVTK